MIRPVRTTEGKTVTPRKLRPIEIINENRQHVVTLKAYSLRHALERYRDEFLVTGGDSDFLISGNVIFCLRDGERLSFHARDPLNTDFRFQHIERLQKGGRS